jgi:multiple sugar transport system substrate-binding protein
MKFEKTNNYSIIGMIISMKNILLKIIVFIVLPSMFISACVPLNNSAAIPILNPTNTPLLITTPTLVPKKNTANENTLPESIPEGITLTFWHPWPGEMANLVAEMVGEFNSTNTWGIKVNSELHSDETVFIDDMNQAIQNGKPPDLIAAPSYYLNYLNDNKFILQDLSKYINSPTWGLSKDVTDSFFPVFWNEDLVSNKRLGIPAYRSGYFIFYNLTWTKELGYSQSPSNIDEFKNQTCKAGLTYLNDNDPSNNGTGGWVYSYNPNAFYSWLKAFRNENVTNENMATILGRNENTEAGNYLSKLFLDNCAWIGRQQQPFEYFSNRQALAYSGRMEDILTQEKVNKLNNSLDQWTVIPYPSNFSNPILLVDGASYAISTADEIKATAAWIFIRWMLNPENQVRVIEKSGTFPLSSTAMEMLSSFKAMHPVWAAALQYLPIIQNSPSEPKWGLTKEILMDISWKIIQFNTKTTDIPIIFQDAQNLLNGLIQ